MRHPLTRNFHFVSLVVPLACALGCIAASLFPGSAAAQDTTPAAPSSSATDTTGATLFPSGRTAPAPELEENRRSGNPNRRGGGNVTRGLGLTAARVGNGLAARAAKDPLEVRIAFRKAKTTVLLLHPELTTLEREAAAASTDVQKRAYLRSYYTQLYAAVRKTDPSPALASHVNLLMKVAEQRYDPKIRGTSGEEEQTRASRGGGGGRRGR